MLYLGRVHDIHVTWERVYLWELGSRRKLCKLTIKLTSLKTVKDFANTLKSLPLTASENLKNVSQKKGIFLSIYIYKTCIKELTIFLKFGETFQKLLQPARFLKILLFARYHILGTVPKTFYSNPFQQVTLYHYI